MTATAGNIYVAGKGTFWVSTPATTVTAPADESTAPGTGFIDVGHYSEKGVVLKPSWTKKEIMSSQSGGYPVRTLVTGRKMDIEAELMEELNEEVMVLMFGGGTYTAGTAGKWTYTPPEVGVTDERSIILDFVDGIKLQRFYAPRVVVDSCSDLTFVRDGAVVPKISLSVLFPLVGTNPYTIFGDNGGA